MKTIKLTYNQERTLRDNRYARLRITRNFNTMYIENNLDRDTWETIPYTVMEWTGKELDYKIKGNFED